jgi:hypothetical protein
MTRPYVGRVQAGRLHRPRRMVRWRRRPLRRLWRGKRRRRRRRRQSARWDARGSVGDRRQSPGWDAGRIVRHWRKVAANMRRSRTRDSHVTDSGTPYRIRTDDLRLERAVSWATRRTGQGLEVYEPSQRRLPAIDPLAERRSLCRCAAAGCPASRRSRWAEPSPACLAVLPTSRSVVRNLRRPGGFAIVLTSDPVPTFPSGGACVPALHGPRPRGAGARCSARARRCRRSGDRGSNGATPPRPRVRRR